MDMPQTSATCLLSHRSEPALLLPCILVVISTYAKRVKSPKDPLSVPSEVFSLPQPTQATQRNREVAAPKQLPPVSQQLVSLCCPSTPFQALFITGIWNGFISASLGKMEMKTTKWISSGMWKCWCSDWLKTRIARIQSWLCFFFLIGIWQNSYKSETGVAKNTYYLLTEGSLCNHTEAFSRSMSTLEILVILTTVNYHTLTSRSVCGGRCCIFICSRLGTY